MFSASFSTTAGTWAAPPRSCRAFATLAKRTGRRRTRRCTRRSATQSTALAPCCSTSSAAVSPRLPICGPTWAWLSPAAAAARAPRHARQPRPRPPQAPPQLPHRGGRVHRRRRLRRLAHRQVAVRAQPGGLGRFRPRRLPRRPVAGAARRHRLPERRQRLLVGRDAGGRGAALRRRDRPGAVRRGGHREGQRRRGEALRCGCVPAHVSSNKFYVGFSRTRSNYPRTTYRAPFSALFLN